MHVSLTRTVLLILISLPLINQPLYVTVPEKRDLNEANFILRCKPFKNVCHIETNVNFKLHCTITFDLIGLCSYSKVHL